MSDSDSDALESVRLPREISSPEKKPRKKMVVTHQKRAASSANLAKAREVRAAKKLNKQLQEDEEKALLKELVAERKAAKAKTKAPKSETESESEVSESDSEDEVEFVLSKSKKTKHSTIKAQMDAMAAELAELKQKKPEAAPVNVYFGQRAKPKQSTLDTKPRWLDD